MQTVEDRGVRITDTGGVRTVCLDRPSKLNAFNRDLYRGLRSALAEVADDTETGCVILTGHGRAFTAGSDLDDDSATGDDDPYQDCLELIESFPKPFIAAVNGLAIGIGMTILGHADLVLASSSARFRAPFATLGLVPEAGSTATLPALVGPQHAAYLLFSGDWLSAEQAQCCGLVWRLVADDDLAGEAEEVAGQIAQMPIESLVATKRLLLRSRLDIARAARKEEDAEFTRLLTGPAHRAAVERFRRGDRGVRR